MGDTAARPSLAEVLASEPEDGHCDAGPLAHYAEVTPRALAILNLTDCQQQLERWNEEPLRLAQAAKAVHLAMQAALTDALAGSTGLGAYSEKLRAEYLAYFEESRTGEAKPPVGDFVLPFPALLARAMQHPMEWSGRKLEVSQDELKALDRLTFIRHRVEHPRPQSHFIEPLFIALTLPVAARLTQELLDVCAHQYEEGERAAVKSSVANISRLCSDVN